jgi:hypothetical protein
VGAGTAAEVAVMSENNHRILGNDSLRGFFIWWAMSGMG